MTVISETATSVTISSLELAHRLGQPSPTPQQQAVIEADLAPALVVAGAGSGKTETMANRVLWLLATGAVQPGEILGLTFTRKAAGELTERISRRIAELRSAGLMPGALSANPGAPQRSADQSGLLDAPTVSTYNAFANAIFRDNALIVGREPESVLLNEASAWRLARRVVVRYGDERLSSTGRTVDAVTDAVLELSRDIAENSADPGRVSCLARDFGSLAEIPYTDGKAKAAPYSSVVESIAQVAPLPALVELAVAYAEEKKRLGLVEFSDQVALALAVVRRSEAVVAEYRHRYRVVLLDEYQDTSVVQTDLLKTLFARHPVMAVGDPNQSIYGWRGASAANLARFSDDFTGTRTGARQFALSTSWRNERRILEVANVIIRPLSTASVIPVENLTARPSAGEGEVRSWFGETVDDEAKAVAEWLAERIGCDDPAVPLDNRPSAALLFRVRQHMELFAEALADRGIPHQILGLGGLLSTPEIVDVVSALRVLSDPQAGSELIRLLAGARWQVGVRDLKALSQLAGWLNSRNLEMGPLSQDIRDRLKESVADDDSRSIVDAIDFVASAPDGHGQLQNFTPAGLVRLRDAGRTFAFLRGRAGLGLLELVRLIEQELRIDIEVSANESSGSFRNALANLHAFHDEISGFLAGDELGTLSNFLAWLDRAEKRDDMSPRTEPSEPGTVQLLTIHGAKGLEWDVVAVPRLIGGELPAASKEGAGWLRFGKLPFEFRGDARELPQLAWRSFENQKEFDTALKAFKAELAGRHQMEERRLAYVAGTRAKKALLFTGSFWGNGATVRTPSTFLSELAEAGVIPPLPTESEFDENPLAGHEVTTTWPMDPLGARRARVEHAATQVLSADPDGVGAYQRDIDLLLAERDQRAHDLGRVALPTRIPASRFKDYVFDAAAVAAQLRRPMPERPYRQTRLGTLFHGWVEARSLGAVSGDLIDAMNTEFDLDPEEPHVDSEELTRLQRLFEASEWSGRKPVEVETEIHLRLGNNIIICKIDAVYRIEGDDPGRRASHQIVDWKTGKAPRDARDLDQKQLQLALYRLAYAKKTGIDPALIDAVFYFVSDDRVIRPDRLYSEAELLDLWEAKGVQG